MEKALFETPFRAEMKSHMMWNVAKIICQATVVGSSILLYKTGGWPLNNIVRTIKDILSKLFSIELMFN